MFVLQMIPVVAAVLAVVVTVLYVVLRGSAGEKKKKLPVTLQDSMVKYALPLVDKQVSCIQTHTFNKEPVLLADRFTFRPNQQLNIQLLC